MRSLSICSIVMLLVVFAAGCTEEVMPTTAIGDATIENSGDALAKNGVIHHASMGGADICEALGRPTGCDANFSLVANMKADGSVKGEWQDTFAGGGEGIHVDVNCLNVVGNGAVIGGVIRHGQAFGVDVSGQNALTAIVDNGTSAKDPADQLSFSFFDTGGLLCTQLVPGNFPLFDLGRGQVKVW